MEVDSLATAGRAAAPTRSGKAAEDSTVKNTDKPSETIKEQSANALKDIKKAKSHESVRREAENEKAELEEISLEYMNKMIVKANKKLLSINRELSYSLHAETNRVMVKVLDKETKEVIREIPEEKSLDLVAKMWELVGIIIDEKI